MKKQSTMGFTLIEVLVALAILAIGLLALSQTMKDNIARLSAIKSRIATNMVAQNILTLKQLNIIPSSVEQGHTALKILEKTRYWKSTQNHNDVPYRGKIIIHVLDKQNGRSIRTLTGYQWINIPLTIQETEF